MELILGRKTVLIFSKKLPFVGEPTEIVGIKANESTSPASAFGATKNSSNSNGEKKQPVLLIDEFPDELVNDDSVDERHFCRGIGFFKLDDAVNEHDLGPVFKSSFNDNCVICVTVDKARVEDDVDGTE